MIGIFLLQRLKKIIPPSSAQCSAKETISRWPFWMTFHSFLKHFLEFF